MKARIEAPQKTDGKKFPIEEVPVDWTQNRHITWMRPSCATH